MCQLHYFKKLACPVSDQFVLQIVFIFEIEIKSSFRQSGRADHIGYGCLGKALACEILPISHFKIYCVEQRQKGIDDIGENRKMDCKTPGAERTNGINV